MLEYSRTVHEDQESITTVSIMPVYQDSITTIRRYHLRKYDIVHQHLGTSVCEYSSTQVLIVLEYWCVRVLVLEYSSTQVRIFIIILLLYIYYS